MANNNYAYLFGDSQAAQQAAAQRGTQFQTWLNTRKQAAERQRTSDVNMAKYNALGNLLTTMVQPVGWAVGGGGFKNGGTGNVQPYDNRQYIDAFNRAVRANDDIRNIGTQEAEYQFKMADEAYRRQLALDDSMRNYELRQQEKEQQNQYKQEQQEQLYQLKSELEAQKAAARIERDAQNAANKYRFKVGGKPASKSDTQKFLEKAASTYMGIVSDYEKKKAAGINMEAPKSFDDFLKEYGPQNGVTISDGTSQTVTKPAGSSRTTKPSGSSTVATSSGVNLNLG